MATPAPVLLAVFTVIATLAQLPTAAAAIGGARQVEEAPAGRSLASVPQFVRPYEIRPGPAP